jgi:phospholipase C
VDAITEQASVPRFIEDTWKSGRIGNGSFDVKAGSLPNMFSFDNRGGRGPDRLLLDPQTGRQQ